MIRRSRGMPDDRRMPYLRRNRATHIAPAASAGDDAKKDRAAETRTRRSIYPWLFSLPLAATVLIIIGAMLMPMRDEVRMKESVRAL